MLNDYLSDCGFSVVATNTGDSLIRALDEQPIDLVLLDLRMPQKDGFATLREIRATRTVPVIMLTAAGEIVDKILGLEFGADDYLVKPVDLRELQARIKSALRRAYLVQSRSIERTASSVPVATGHLDLTTAQLFDTSGDEIAITAMEFALLRVLSENRGRPMTRDQLLDKAHNGQWDPFDRSIDLRISRLRKKIEPVPEKPEYRQTVRGIGYVLR